MREPKGPPNPKDLIGAKKVSLTKFPLIGLIHGAHAMMDGAVKYGPYNWRDYPVQASIYVDALLRHVIDWFEGQEAARDSEAHHLGHAIACAAIILDAQENGTLIDDRPIKGKPDKLDKVLKRLQAIIERRAKAKKEEEDAPGDIPANSLIAQLQYRVEQAKAQQLKQRENDHVGSNDLRGCD